MADHSDFYTVDYPISSTVAKLNSEFYSSDSLLQVRQELIHGSQSVNDSRLSIAYEDSIMGSFLAQVRKQHGHSLSNHDILFHTLIVGHSQGAGHAAVIALDYNLSGVLLISGPSDSYQHVPSSWTGIKAKTSRSRYKMFIHAEDRHTRMCLYHSTLLGLKKISVLTESSVLEEVISSQVVIDTRPLPPLRSHDCLTFDSAKLDDFNKLYLAAVIESHKRKAASSEFQLSSFSR